jgi:hypothetical protein
VSETALTKMPETSPTKSDPVELLRKRYEKLQKTDLEITHLMDRFAELPSFVEETARAELIQLLANGTDAEIQEKYGFRTKRELRVAMYGTLPKKDWPASMQSAHERVMARIRKQTGEKRSNTFNLNIINMPAPVRPTEHDKIITIKAKEPDGSTS